MSLFYPLLFMLFSIETFAQELGPKPLLQDNLSSWYEKHTQFSVDEDFGITRIELYKNELLIGMATKQKGPIDRDGAMVASLDLKTHQLSKLAYLYEQGLYDMVVINDVLHIPGTDPRFNPKTDPEGEKGYPFFYWNLGNWYRIDLTQTPRTRELIRNLPFVVHGWGQWFDEKNQTIYHATSRVTCEEPAADRGDCYQRPGAQNGGALFKSADFGSTWNLTDDRDSGIGDYRTYDVQGTTDALFVVWADAFAGQVACGLARKKNGESEWLRLQKVRVPCHIRLQSYKEQLIAVDEIGKVIIVDPKNTKAVSTYSGDMMSPDFKTFILPDLLNFYSINPIKISKNEKTVYFLGQNGVYFSEDLVNWSLLIGSQGLLDMEDIAIDDANKIVYVATRTQIYSLSQDHFRKVAQ